MNRNNNNYNNSSNNNYNNGKDSHIGLIHPDNKGNTREGEKEVEEADEKEREQRAWLGSQLLRHPETFLAVLDLLGQWQWQC